MSINLTLIIQTAVFLAVVWLTMKYIWPVILGAMEEREKKIADGLAASDEAETALQAAQVKADEIVNEAKLEASAIRDQASQSATKIKEQAKTDALAEKERQLTATQIEIEQEANRAKEALRQEVSVLAVAGAERLLDKEIDAQKHKDLLDKLIKEI